MTRADVEFLIERGRISQRRAVASEDRERARLADVLGRELTDEEFQAYQRGRLAVFAEQLRAAESAG